MGVTNKMGGFEQVETKIRNGLGLIKIVNQTIWQSEISKNKPMQISDGRIKSIEIKYHR